MKTHRSGATRATLQPAMPTRSSAPCVESAAPLESVLGNRALRVALVEHAAQRVARSDASRVVPARSADVTAATAPAIDGLANEPGRPLDAGVRREFELAFGRDLEQVRIHTSAHAVRSAELLGAGAYTGCEDLIAAAPAPLPLVPVQAARAPIPAPVRAKMEGALGADFSDVRVHPGSARAVELGALAFTQGSEIHVAPGQWAPETKKGQELLGHELGHVLQQRAGRVKVTAQLKGVGLNAEPALEVEADAMGARAARGDAAHERTSFARGHLAEVSEESGGDGSRLDFLCHGELAGRRSLLTTAQRKAPAAGGKAIQLRGQGQHQEKTSKPPKKKGELNDSHQANYDEIQNITNDYRFGLVTFTQGLVAAIDEAKSNVQNAASFKDGDFWTQIAIQAVADALSLIPAGGTLAGILQKWGMGKLSSVLAEKFVSDIAKDSSKVMGNAAGPSGNAITDLSIQLSNEAFELKNGAITMADLEGKLIGWAVSALNSNRAFVPTALKLAKAMSSITPTWSNSAGKAFVLKFEEQLWNFLFSKRYYTLTVTSRVWGFAYSTTLMDSYTGGAVAGKTIQYIIKRFGWDPLSKVTVRKTQGSPNIFGGLDNR